MFCNLNAAASPVKEDALSGRNGQAEGGKMGLRGKEIEKAGNSAWLDAHKKAAPMGSGGKSEYGGCTRHWRP